MSYCITYIHLLVFADNLGEFIVNIVTKQEKLTKKAVKPLTRKRTHNSRNLITYEAMRKEEDNDLDLFFTT